MHTTSMAVSDNEIASGLALSQVSLTNFRNYESLRLNLQNITPCPIVLFGENGAGKTNLLEAISYLSTGRGIRGSKLGDVSNIHSNKPWAVAAKLFGKSGAVDIGTGLGRTSSDEFSENGEGRDKRLVKIDGVNVSGPAALSQHISLVWLTPKMDRLFNEGVGGRRKFFDQMVSGLDPNHSKQISSYERAMRERIRLLTDQSLGSDPSWIGALERKMAEHGVAIAASRIEVLAQLSAQIKKALQTAFPRADISLEGFLEKELGEYSALEVEEIFKSLLEKNRVEERLTGRTLIGPHKTDMIVCHVDKEMPAHLCSTGEQKALMIGIILAHGKMLKNIQGAAPILLLDEVAAHLDEGRRRLLFEELMALGSQAWLTGTDKELFEFLLNQSEMFKVNDANLNRV